jgi:hypothetical protein
MPARLIYSLFALVGLVLLAAALWLPVDFGHAAPVPTGPAADMSILPGDCALFVTFRPGSLTKNEVVRAFGEGSGMFENMQRDFGVPLADVERVTIATVGNAELEIIRTRKPFDKKKLIEHLESRYGFKGSRFKDKDKRVEEEKAQANEKKIGGKVVYFMGQAREWTRGLCVIDRHVFVRGNLRAIEGMLESKAKRSDELNEMLAQAAEHTLVAGFQGAPLRAMLHRDNQRYNRPKYAKDKAGDPNEDSKKEDDTDPIVPVGILPYKPLVMMKTARITVDLGKTATASAKIIFDSKEAADDGELALKTALYSLRELARMAPRMESELRPLAPLSESLQKAFKGAKITRKDNTLETSVRLTVSVEAAKKITEEFAAEKKRREEREKKFSKDKFRDFPKDGFKDK